MRISMKSNAKESYSSYIFKLLNVATFVMFLYCFVHVKNIYYAKNVFLHYDEFKYKNIRIDSIIEIGAENSFQYTGDLFRTSVTAIGLSTDIYDGKTSIFIDDTICFNTKTLLHQNCWVAYNNHSAYLLKNQHTKLIGFNDYLASIDPDDVFYLKIFAFLFLVTMVYNVSLVVISLITRQTDLIKKIAKRLIYLTLIFVIGCSILWFGMCVFLFRDIFDEKEHYQSYNKFSKRHIEVDSFIETKAEAVTMRNGIKSHPIFEGFSGVAYAKELNNYKTKITYYKADLVVEEDSLDPMPFTYFVWYNPSSNMAFIPNYREQEQVLSLSGRIMSRLKHISLIKLYILFGIIGLLVMIIKVFKV